MTIPFCLQYPVKICGALAAKDFLLREGWKRLSFYCGVHETIKDKSGQPDGGLSAGLPKDLVSAGTPKKKS